MSLILSKSGIKLKIETSGRIDTDTPVYSEGVLISKPEYDSIEFHPMTPYRGSQQKLQVGDFARLPFEIAGFLTTGLEFEIPILACGFLKEDIDTTGHKYTPQTSNNTKISYDLVTARETHQGNGGVANISLSANIGDRVEAKFAISGCLTAVVEKNIGEADFEIPFAPTPSFVLMDSISAYSEGGNEIDVESFSFELSSEAKQIKSTMSNEYYIADIKPTIKVKARDSADKQKGYADFLANTPINIEVLFKDAAGNTKWKFTAPKAVCDGIDTSDNDGTLATEKSYILLPINGDDNFALEYTI